MYRHVLMLTLLIVCFRGAAEAHQFHAKPQAASFALRVGVDGPSPGSERNTPTRSVSEGLSPARDIEAEKLDQHALAAPVDVEKSLDRLAAYLLKPARSDRDKARLIFRWMTDRIGFDVDAFCTGNRGAVRAEAVLQNRLALGEGYAVLFEALARRCGLAAALVPGQVKGMPNDGMAESKNGRTHHVWNAVGIDGAWQLLDVAWGAGFVKGQRFHKLFQEQYFLTPPQQLCMTHFPADYRWQLLLQPLTLPQFDSLAPVEVGFVRLGFSREFRLSDKNRPPDVMPYNPATRTVQIGAVKVMAAPVGKTLPAFRDYYFLLEAPQADRMMLRNNDRWIELQKTGTRFEGNVSWAEPGTLRLQLQVRGRDDLQTVLEYKVTR